MDPTEVTIEILRGIREEVRNTNERLDGLRADVSERLDRVDRRQTETEVRLATELVGVAGAVREVRDLLREDATLRVRVDDLERRVGAIEKRAG